MRIGNCFLKYFWIVFLIFFLGLKSISQPCPAWTPCNSGSGSPTCQCETAPLLCTINCLQGYTFQMGNSGTPPPYPDLCPGLTNTSWQNPTWLRFIAVCSDFTVNLSFSGCTGFGLSRGIQAAIYSDCNDILNSTVACDADFQTPCGGPNPPCFGCGVTSGTRTLNVTGAIQGEVYYLIVDGCGGSRCTVNFSINAPGCDPGIAPWPSGIMGDEIVCINSTHEYTTEVPTGGIRFDWEFVGGSPSVDDSEYVGNPTISTMATFTQTGTFTLCIDASNECVPFSANPPQQCKVIKVLDAEAGTIIATPNPLCPTSTTNITATGYNTDPDISQYILIADENGILVQVTQGSTATWTWPTCGMFTAYSYNYITALGTEPMVGDDVNTMLTNCSAGNCCELEPVVINFQDSQPPVLTGLPQNLSVSCYVDVPPIIDLNFTDNCMGSGTVQGEQVDDYTNCDGGTITRSWMITDRIVLPIRRQ